MDAREERSDLTWLDWLEEPAFVVDGVGVIVGCNRPAGGLLGRLPVELIGQSCASVVGGVSESGEAVCSAHCPFIEKRGSRPATVEMVIPKEGSQPRRLVLVNHIPLKVGGGRLLHLMSERKSQEVTSQAGSDSRPLETSAARSDYSDNIPPGEYLG
jgi:PAS domain-containing protein